MQPRIGSQVWQQVETLIREEWSPEQIVGRVAMEQGVSISHEWIYQYIYADQRSGGDLYRFLRCQKVRRKGYGVYSRRGCIPNQVSIDAPGGDTGNQDNIASFSTESGGYLTIESPVGVPLLPLKVLYVYVYRQQNCNH